MFLTAVEEAHSMWNDDDDSNTAISGHAFARAWAKAQDEDGGTPRVCVRIKSYLNSGTPGDRYAVSVPKNKVTAVVAALLNDPKVHTVAVGEFAENV